MVLLHLSRDPQVLISPILLNSPPDLIPWYRKWFVGAPLVKSLYGVKVHKVLIRRYTDRAIHSALKTR